MLAAVIDSDEIGERRGVSAVGAWHLVVAIGRAAWLTALAIRLFFRPAVLHLLKRDSTEAEVARGLRRLLEAGGVTTVKIGQYLAIRRDLFSALTCAELSRLLDAVPPMPGDRAAAIIAGELGTPIATWFAGFDPVPIGAASIAQVHRARLHDGTRVAVKIQRDGIVTTMTADFRLIAAAAALADRLGLFSGVGAQALVAEIAAFTMRETDFRIEGRTADRIAADPERGVRIPRIHWTLSTRRVLVMDLIVGVPLARVIARGGEAKRLRITPAVIAERLCEAFLRQLFVTGFFHGDPHPGNVMIERGGGIALIDFGIFGEISGADRLTLAAYVENLALGRIEAAFDCYAALVTLAPTTDVAAYRRATQAILRGWHEAATDPATPVERQLTAYYQGLMFEVMRRHRVRLAPEHLLFWRALGLLDSTAHQLPGQFDLLAAVRRFFADIRPGIGVRGASAVGGLVDYVRLTRGEAARAVAAVTRRPAIPIVARLPGGDDARAVALPLAALALALHAAALPHGPAAGVVAGAAALVAIGGVRALWTRG